MEKRTWRGIMLIQNFVLIVINNEIKILTRHEIIDCIAEQIEFVITQVRKGSKLWIHPNLRGQISHLLMKRTLKKGILLKK